ncbi:MAG: leucine--tRNA ligase [Mollicutes bacterium]|nr:leucine--tRNA ligase [Mollicutes bacterium]
MNYNEIEKKWQDYWDKHNSFKAYNDIDKKPYYILVEFPYPSGTGLHVGHVRSYTAQDALARMKRMQGYNVLYPMGWDSFGAPAEQYAVQNRIHPKDAVRENINTFKRQMKTLGFSFDWDREFSTTDPDYYKWTQWQFLQFYKHNMAYKASVNVNWCPKCKSVLSNEDAAGGVCERCSTKVEQKRKNQWMLRMSSYAEDLLNGLDDTNFADRVKLGQINWIGKSSGIKLKIDIVGGGSFDIFTTCIETVYGITFFVIAPDGKLIEELLPRAQNKDEIKKYINETKLKSNMDRTEFQDNKTGVIIKGIKAIHPINKREIPIFISDFVLGDYGTGAVMAVPAHDQRDYEFAKTYNIDIIEVIKGGNINEKAYEKEDYLEKGCILINSEEFNNLTVEEAKEKIYEKLKKMGIAEKEDNYKMRDWIFSRQRFWGEPIPMIECPKCGWVMVEEKDLPVLLPDIAEYEPTDTGESPLAKIDEWVNCKCPKCGANAKRETDTMPNWAGSSWYFLRFMDPHNDKEFASMDAMKYWKQVDWYNGGMEHTARHLLYARFWVQFLYNIGLVPKKEMIWTRVSHGMILGSNNEKMSKSKGNVVNPDDIIKEYGADTLRCYEMFIGDYQMDAPWSTESLRGCKRFIDKVVRLKDKINPNLKGYSKKFEVIQNKTIKKITEDLVNLSYNTAVSALMILSNNYDDEKEISHEDYTLLLTLLNPIAPHITEELNEIIGNKPIVESLWPKYDKNKLTEDEITISVSVNGKFRGVIKTKVDENKEQIIKLAKECENVKKHIANKKIKKEIIVPNKIINFIVE